MTDKPLEFTGEDCKYFPRCQCDERARMCATFAGTPYRGWFIHIAHDDCNLNYEFCHRDFCADDDNDDRYGSANTIEDARRQIDMLEAENAAEPEPEPEPEPESETEHQRGKA